LSALFNRAVPMLGRLGIAGIGVAPAVIALVLYALLPICAQHRGGASVGWIRVSLTPRAAGDDPAASCSGG